MDWLVNIRKLSLIILGFDILDDFYFDENSNMVIIVIGIFKGICVKLN